MSNPIVTITMEDGKMMKAELYPDIAPNTVNNFISLVKKGFYNGLIFHRVIKGFMIQGGCPQGNGMGGPGYSIKGEFAQNGFPNNLKHTEGVLSMARAMSPNSAGSQFFIMHKAAPHLDGAYAAFGKITEGMDVVNAIAEVQTDYNDRPLKSQRIQTSTFGRSLCGLWKDYRGDGCGKRHRGGPNGLQRSSPEEPENSDNDCRYPRSGVSGPRNLFVLGKTLS